MSDMLAVILAIIDDEVDAFWCFVGLMDTSFGMKRNFADDGHGMKGHLAEVEVLLRFVTQPSSCFTSCNRTF